MPFNLKAIPDITVDVSFHVPGESAPSTVQARWKLHSWDDFQARASAIQRGEISDEQLVEKDLLGLDGINDEDGQALPYSPRLVADLLQITFFRRSLIASWFEAQHGRAAAAEKN